MILGYSIMEPDNGQNMFDNLKLDDCARYSNIYDLNIIDPGFKLKNKKKNISCTYDGFTIVSKLFRQFCDDEHYGGLEFISLPNDPDFYWFKIHRLVEYDSIAGETKFSNYNSICKGHEEITGATPVCLTQKTALADGFYRTDICFGSFAGKSPVYLVGEDTMKKLNTAGFSEIYFQKILDKYDWQKLP